MTHRLNLEALSEISFTRVANQLLLDGITRLYELDGSCLDLTFSLRFEVNDRSMAVQSLHIQIDPRYDLPLIAVLT